MKDKRQHHQHSRNQRGFEHHSRNRGSDEVRRGQAWRFNIGPIGFDAYEPHFRITARIAALPGKHIRSVREPVRAAHHGKAL